MTRLTPILLVACVLGCGGAFDKDDDDDGGQAGSAGNAGTASSGASGGSGGGGGSCVWKGQTYEEGEAFYDDCNSCVCTNGGVGCTAIGCEAPCTYEGNNYGEGTSFPAGDGCNTCTCESATVVCTRLACNSCESVDAASGTYVEQAKKCDPAAPNQCTQLVAGALDCACPTYVNPENQEAIAALAATHEEYASLMCGPPPCDCASPSGAFCGPAGECVDLYDGGLAACEVDGQVYPSGASGFAGPLGCGTCSCSNGELECTDEACPSACPPNAVLGSHCSQCDAFTGGCAVVEHTCLELCADTCESGTCVDGVCKNVCD